MKLKTFFEIAGIDQKDFADMVQTSPAMISYMLAEKKSPGLRLALRIQKATKGKVRPEDWKIIGG